MNKSKPTTAHRFRGVTMPTSSHPLMRQVRREGVKPSIHGNKLWKSSRLLIDYLGKNRPEHCNSVIDVGCGWGISGIWCAKTLGSQVTSADADPDVFPYLEASASLNGVSTTPLVSTFEKLTTKQLSQFDMLIAADICFWDEMVQPLIDFIHLATESGVKNITIADPGRPPFWELSEYCTQSLDAEIVTRRIYQPWKTEKFILSINNQ